MPRINPIMMTSKKKMADVSMRLLRGAIPAAAVILATLSGHAAWSQTARTIKIVVPYPPGGGPDILARLLADQIGRARGPTMVIENRPGAGTGIATEAVARAAPDGGTLLIADSNFVIIPHFRKLNYDPRTGFEPVCQLVSSPQIIVVNSASPYRTLADLLNAARAKPGDLTLASVGPASLPQIGLEMLKRAADVEITFVPYTGTAAAVNALLGGHVTSVFGSYAALAEQVKVGTLRALATATLTRIEPLPDVPTGAESGYKGYEADLWDGVVVPAKTPRETIAEIAGWFTAALREPETRRKLVAQGLFPVGTCGADFGALIRKQYDEYGRVIRESNIKAE
jgi:tripartite-type tricarboxylate transporter receptor subunit TctC